MKKRNIWLTASVLLGLATQSTMPVLAEEAEEASTPPAVEAVPGQVAEANEVDETDPALNKTDESETEVPNSEVESPKETADGELEENKAETAPPAEAPEDGGEATEEVDHETATAEEPTDEGHTTLHLMHINDTHAHVHRYPQLLTLIKNHRVEYAGHDTMLLHAGDVFSGTLYFNEFEGAADLKLLNMMDIDAMVFGNHAFDLGRSEEGHSALVQFIKNSNFPHMGTNVDFSADDKFDGLVETQPVVHDPAPARIYDHIILEKNGEKYGIFGLTTEDTKDTGSPEKVTFENYIQTAKNSVQILEDAGINKIIALTHLGYDTSPRVGSDIELAKHVDGIDIIVGGHSHTALEEPHLARADTDNPTLIVQAGANGEYLGVLEVVFDENGKIIAYKGELQPTENVEPDPVAEEALAPFREAVEEVEKQEIGVLSPGLENPRRGADEEGPSVRANETPLGNLVTDAMLAKAKEKFPTTVIAVQNGGGIRAAIPEGPITQGQIISVLPFGNNPVIADLTGAEIKDLMEHSVREAPAELGGFLHVSGMKLYYDSTKKGKNDNEELADKLIPGDRVIGMYLVDENGEITEEIQPDRVYRVTTNGFTGTGGEHPVFEVAYSEGRVQDIGETDWMQLRDYIVETFGEAGVVSAEVEGRIIDLQGQPDPNKIATTPEETEQPEESGSDQEDPIRPEDEEDTPDPDQAGDGQEPKEPETDQGDPSRPEDEITDSDQADDGQKEKKETGKKPEGKKDSKGLPQTGQDSATLPLIISGGLLAGGAFFSLNRRRNAK